MRSTAGGPAVDRFLSSALLLPPARLGVSARHCRRPISLRTVELVDRKEEIREFLISRRAKASPEQAGIPSYGELRRVPGLRREEVAQLAGVSTDYYTRLERGSIRGVSDSVLEAVASALQLDEAERTHLMDLARTAKTPSSRTPRRPMQQRVRPGVLRLLDGMTGVAAMVQNGRGDVLAGNMLGRALYSEVFNSAVSFGRDVPGRLPNQARYIFLDPRAADYYPDWNAIAAIMVAMLRLESPRPGAERDGRRAHHGQQPVRRALGRSRRADPHHRNQALPPPGGRRPVPAVRNTGPSRRRRADRVHLHRRARLRLRNSAGIPRQLGGNATRRNHPNSHRRRSCRRIRRPRALPRAARAQPRKDRTLP
jgi:transcriptional regulator with XRE-family HTH domain